MSCRYDRHTTDKLQGNVIDLCKYTQNSYKMQIIDTVSCQTDIVIVSVVSFINTFWKIRAYDYNEYL